MGGVIRPGTRAELMVRTIFGRKGLGYVVAHNGNDVIMRLDVDGKTADVCRHEIRVKRQQPKDEDKPDWAFKGPFD